MRYLLLALSFISIIPLPKKLLYFDEQFHKVVAFFPLAGALLGVITYVFYYLLIYLLPKGITFVLAISFYHILNGGLHLDGYVDFFDAVFGSKKDSKRFKEILKDSRIGTMGSFAIILYFLIIIKVSDIIIPDIKSFIFLGMAGRLTIVNCAVYSKSLFEEGLGKFFIERVGLYEFIFGNLSFFILSGFLGLSYLYLAIGVFIFSFIYKMLILKSYKGFSGDLFGAGCIITEMIVFISYLWVD